MSYSPIDTILVFKQYFPKSTKASLFFFFLEYAGELHIIALRRGKRPK